MPQVHTHEFLTIPQMIAWAGEVSAFTVTDCHRALHDINERRVTIRRVA